jgi:hypothetical protein
MPKMTQQGIDSIDLMFGWQVMYAPYCESTDCCQGRLCCRQSTSSAGHMCATIKLPGPCTVCYSTSQQHHFSCSVACVGSKDSMSQLCTQQESPVRLQLQCTCSGNAATTQKGRPVCDHHLSRMCLKPDSAACGSSLDNNVCSARHHLVSGTSGACGHAGNSHKLASGGHCKGGGCVASGVGGGSHWGWGGSNQVGSCCGDSCSCCKGDGPAGHWPAIGPNDLGSQTCRTIHTNLLACRLEVDLGSLQNSEGEGRMRARVERWGCVSVGQSVTQSVCGCG